MRLALLCSLSIFAFLPATAFATIEISEIAWMGNTTSANYEWIELHNSGSDTVDIIDWKFSGEDDLKLDSVFDKLSGPINPGQYVVLERNRETGPYLNIPPFGTYTGALINSGLKLTLKLVRSDGEVEDIVYGGENWSFGGNETIGDNATKDTAQLTSNGWITAPPTPGRANATVASPTITTDTSSPSPSPKTSKPSVKVETPKPTAKDSLQLSLIVPSTAYVNQTVGFDVAASGIDSLLIGSLRYYWNFGDLDADNKKKTTHVYTYPGTYVVTLYASLTHKDQTARREITVLPVIASLSNNSSGDIQINNDSPYELDLSGYTLLGSTEIKFPPRTVLLSRSTITVPEARIAGGWGQVVTLSDAKGVKVASTADINESDFNQEFVDDDSFEVQTELIDSDNLSSTYFEPVSQFGFSDETPPQNDADTKEQNQVAPEPDLDELEGLDDVGVPAGTPTSSYWPYLALVLLITIATSSLFFTKKTE